MRVGSYTKKRSNSLSSKPPFSSLAMASLFTTPKVPLFSESTHMDPTTMTAMNSYSWMPPAIVSLPLEERDEACINDGKGS